MVEPSQIEHWIQAEWNVITSSPVLFLVALAGIVIPSWILMRSICRQHIRSKDSIIEIKDATIETLRMRLEETGISRAQIVELEEARLEQKIAENKRVIKTLTKAIKAVHKDTPVLLG